MNTIRHIALRTEDPERLCSFYQQVFGLQRIGEETRGGAFLTDGYLNLAMLGGAGRESRGGIYHFGFQVDSQREILQRILELNISKPPKVRPEDRPYAETRASDPDGNFFDISERGYQDPDPPAGGWTYEMDEAGEARNSFRMVAIRSENTHRLRRFYTHVFGLQDVVPYDENAPPRDDDSFYLTDGHFVLALLSNADQNAINGIYHFGFQVGSVDEIEQRIRDLDMTRPPRPRPDSSPYPGVRASDPDLNYFDITQQGFAPVEPVNETANV